MRVSVFNIVLNLLLVVLKAVAGLAAGSDMLLSDAVHSCADTLCTVLVLSGIGFAAKHPGALAEKVQAAVVFVLALTIGGTGAGMLYGACSLLSGKAQTAPPTAVAVVAAGFCMLIKAGMSLATARMAKRLRNDTLLADAHHHRSDCLSSLLVLVGVAAAFVQLPAAEIIARVLLGCSLLCSAVSLARNAFQKMYS